MSATTGKFCARGPSQASASRSSPPGTCAAICRAALSCRYFRAIASTATWQFTRSILTGVIYRRRRARSSIFSRAPSVPNLSGTALSSSRASRLDPVQRHNGCRRGPCCMNAPADLARFSLDDKYTVERGRVFLTGTQALIRLLMLQRTRDERAGLNTAGFVSGYRGSPLGGLDQALWRAQKHLESHHVRFQPGVNEDLAAAAIWGTQQVTMFPKAKYGGVLVLAGDDHAAKSSTLPHQSEHIFKACLIPHLNPASVQDYLDLGLHGIAMSRYSGCWICLLYTSDAAD